jgi:hypothetical protein
MKFNSYEIEEILFNRQLDLYQRIDDMIKKHFDELDSDRLAVLSRTLLELEERMQLYKRGLQHSELYGVTYRSIRKDKKLEGLSLFECLPQKLVKTL